MVSLLLVVGAFGLFKLELVLQGGNEALARTVAVNIFVFGEMLYLFNCRSITKPFWVLGVWSNRPLWAGITVMILLQLMFTYFPPLQAVFQSAPLGLMEWGFVLINSAVIFIIVEAEKKIRGRAGGVVSKGR
jgi:Ca2+-transporting ATPase